MLSLYLGWLWRVDFSYYVQTNVSIKRGIFFKAIAYTKYIRERYYYSLVCTF